MLHVLARSPGFALIEPACAGVEKITPASRLAPGGRFRGMRGLYVCAQGDLGGDGTAAPLGRWRVANDVPGSEIIAAGGLRVLNELE